MPPPRRLTGVLTARLLAPRLLAAVAVMVLALPASGQSGPSLSVEVGVGGFVVPSEPTIVSVTIASPVLITGRVLVATGQIRLSRPVEVPAGGEQVYDLVLPGPPEGSQVVVQLLDGPEELLSQDLVVRTAGSVMPVGVVDIDGLPATLDRVRSVVTDRPVEGLVISGDISPVRLRALDYLVVGPAGVEQLSELSPWIVEGGNLVADADEVDPAEWDVEAVPTGVEGVQAALVGAGRVVLVDDLEDRSVEDWGRILRPAAIEVSNPQFMGPEQSHLMSAATATGDRQIPSLPWLLFAILGFAMVVGPVNFVVLSKLRKRDWAWVTIPVISLLALSGFWLAGRQRIQGTTLSHATTVVVDGEVAEAHSAVVVAAGTAGERVVSFDEADLVYPEPLLSAGAATSELRFQADGSVALDLAQLGFAGTGLRWEASDGAVPAVTSEPDGVVTVENTTGLTFWGWGVLRSGFSHIGRGELTPGEEARVEVGDALAEPAFGFNFIDQLMNERQLWSDPVRSNVVWPMGNAAGARLAPGGTYFVGLTDDLDVPVTVDGEGRAVEGMSLVAVGVDPGSAVGRASAQVVGTGLVNWVEGGPNRIIGTNELVLAFQLPDATLRPRLHDSQHFEPGSMYSAWDWDAAEFAQVTLDEEIDNRRFVSADGVVYIRMSTGDGDEFSELPMSPDSVTLGWQA